MRFTSLFKYVYTDGKILYNDVNRFLTYYTNESSNALFYSGSVSKLINKLYPITMPYIPGKPIKVYVEEYLTDEKNGDFDTIEIQRADIPDEKTGEYNRTINIYRYFKETEHDFKEIDIREFVNRKKLHNERLNKK